MLLLIYSIDYFWYAELVLSQGPQNYLKMPNMNYRNVLWFIHFLFKVEIKLTSNFMLLLSVVEVYFVSTLYID